MEAPSVRPNYATLGLYWREVKRDPCTPMFSVALFTIAEVWNQCGRHQ